MRSILALMSAAVVLLLASPAPSTAQGLGPVGTQCRADLDRFCRGVGHGNMEARLCLEAHRASVSAACRRALDTTGGPRGRGRNR